jgi:hypothetical protein
MGKAFSDIERFDGSNTSGVFRVRWSKAYFYYVTEAGTTVSIPLMNGDWKKAISAREMEASYRGGYYYHT